MLQAVICMAVEMLLRLTFPLYEVILQTDFKPLRLCDLCFELVGPDCPVCPFPGAGRKSSIHSRLHREGGLYLNHTFRYLVFLSKCKFRGTYNTHYNSTECHKLFLNLYFFNSRLIVNFCFKV